MTDFPCPYRPDSDPDFRLDREGDGLNLQEGGYRPLTYDLSKKAPPFAWKTFLLWMALGLTVVWSLALLIVWVVFQMLGEGGMGLALPGGIGGVVAIMGILFVRMALRMNSSNRRASGLGRPRRRRLPEEYNDPPRN
jgi:hypothetical protein